MTKPSYTGADIRVLEDIEAIRTRPGMYAGDITGVAYHLVKEIIDNSVDEFLNDFATAVWVSYDSSLNQVTIVDNGRGLPVDIHPDVGIPTMEVLVTKSHAGGKFSDGSSGYKQSSGLNGVGLKVVNALSKKFRIISIRNGYQYEIQYEEGVKTQDFTKTKQKDYKHIEHGTVVELIPSEQVLGGYHQLDPKQLDTDMYNRSFINGNLEIHLTIDGVEKVYHHPEGIVDLLKLDEANFFSPMYHFKEHDADRGNTFEVALAYVNSSDTEIIGYANGIQLFNGGTHVTGFKTAMGNEVKKYIKENKITARGIKLDDISTEDVISGLKVIINIRYDRAEYSAQTKDKLTSPEMQTIIGKLVREGMHETLTQNPAEFKPVAVRILQFGKGRVKASTYKENMVKASSTSMTLTITKGSDAWSTDRAACELFIVEGDSAGGTIEVARNREFQALMPLRGKSLNTFGKSRTEIVANAEISNLLLIMFGTNDIRTITPDMCRFGKIIILTDADTDGDHISALLVNFFTEFLPFILTDGRLYVGLPPKYSHQTARGEFLFFKDDDDIAKFELNQIKKKVSMEGDLLKKLIRFKLKFKEIFSQMKHNFVLSDEILYRLVYPEDVTSIEDLIKSYPDIYIADDHLMGLHDAQWHDVYLDDTFYNSLDKVASLIEKYLPGFTGYVTYTYKDVTYEHVALYEFYNFLDKDFHYKYNYFKGLGEADADELLAITIDPETRDLIQLGVEDMEEAMSVNEKLFKSTGKARAERRDMMRAYFAEKANHL